VLLHLRNGVLRGRASLCAAALRPSTWRCVQTTKRMSFAQFKAALDAGAEARGVDATTMRDVVANCVPELRGTVAAPVKWHDDRSMYTGVHAQGGPSTVDKRLGLQDVVDRTAAERARPSSSRRRSTINAWAN
jgi:hypothetical protein